MKLILGFLLSMLSLTGYASKGFEVYCTKDGPHGERQEVKVREMGKKGLVMSVTVNGQQFFSKQVTVETLSDRQYVRSEAFVNTNDVPSRLQLQLYEKGRALVGEFGEISYGPIVNPIYEMICR